MSRRNETYEDARLEVCAGVSGLTNLYNYVSIFSETENLMTNFCSIKSLAGAGIVNRAMIYLVVSKRSLTQNT